AAARGRDRPDRASSLPFVAESAVPRLPAAQQHARAVAVPAPLASAGPVSRQAGWLAALFCLPAPTESARHWHIAPAIDVSAYALGWLPILVPLLFLPAARDGYVLPYLLVLALTGVHRHFALPYV